MRVCVSGSATLTAGVLNDVLDRAADIEVDGGVIHVEWREDGHILMTGPAEPVFTGEWKGSL